MNPFGPSLDRLPTTYTMNLTIIDVDITMVVRELLRRLASNLWQTSHVSPE
jgi:hypothetical protein